MIDQKTILTTAILDAFEDGIYVMNQDLVVEYMNSAMKADFGDGVGKKCHQLLNQSADKCPWCQSDDVFAGKTVRREVHVPRVDKTYYLIEIPITNTDGSISKARSDMIRDLPAPVTAMFPMYSDLRVLHLTAPAFGPGDTLEYRVTEHLVKPEAKGRFWVEHRFERNAIVLDERLEIDLPADEEVRLRTTEGNEPEIETTKRRKRYRWKSAHPAREPGSEDPLELGTLPTADVQVTNFESWREAGSPKCHEHANRIWKRIVEELEPPPIDPSIREELEAFVERRRQEGGAPTDY